MRLKRFPQRTRAVHGAGSAEKKRCIVRLKAGKGRGGQPARPFASRVDKFGAISSCRGSNSFRTCFHLQLCRWIDLGLHRHGFVKGSNDCFHRGICRNERRIEWIYWVSCVQTLNIPPCFCLQAYFARFFAGNALIVFFFTNTQ